MYIRTMRIVNIHNISTHVRNIMWIVLGSKGTRRRTGYIEKKLTARVTFFLHNIIIVIANTATHVYKFILI